MSGDTSRELDALRLMAGVLRAGDTVAELGPCAHSLTTLDGLADDVQVCSAQAQLATHSSLSWLRLASRAALSEEVQQAIGRHRPRILLGAPESESVEELLAALGAPGYCAMARVGAFLFLAPEVDCESAIPPKRASMVDPLRAVFGHARTIGLTGMQLARAKRQRRGLRDAVKHYRPPTVFARKLIKLTTDPQRFLRDAKSPILHGPAATTMAMLFPAKALSASRRETTVFDLPKRSILVFAGPDISKDLELWLRLCEPLTLAIELVVVADAGHHAFFEALLARALSPRMRVYLVAEPLSGQELLEYGIARCYASNLALVHQLGENTAEAISEAFAQLHDDQSYWLGDQPQLIAAKRNRLRDQASEELQSSELADALDGMASRIQISGSVAKLKLVGGSHFFAYATIAPQHSFSSLGRHDVFCLEKRPQWPLPVSTMVRNQQPKVSVIMTVYNAAETLAAAVASVLGQTYQNVELLIIDDGSDDGSLQIALACADEDSRVRVLQTANNSGTYFAKNVGLSFAQGDFVSFHDSDDVSAGNRLELQVEALDCDPLAIANYMRYQRISEDGREVWLGGNTNRPGYITLLFRREQVLKEVGFFDSVRMSADAELVDRLRLVTQRPVRLLPYVGYYALQAEGSLTTAGAGAFAMASDGTMAMPPVRQQYRQAADAWQRACYEGLAQAHIPFPLGTRPFDAPHKIRPDRGVSELSARVLALTYAKEASDLSRELVAELELYGEARVEAKIVEVLVGLAVRKQDDDYRKLFQAMVDALELHCPQSGHAFAARNALLSDTAYSTRIPLMP